MAYNNELWQDVKGLSGVPLFAILIVSSFLLGEKSLAIRLSIGLILAYAVTTVIRIIHFKRRPDKEGYHNFIEKIDASSFPSLHAMRAAVLAIIFGFAFENVLLTSLFVLCAIGVAVSRVATKRHYVSDVVAGLILGFVIGWLATFIS